LSQKSSPYLKPFGLPPPKFNQQIKISDDLADAIKGLTKFLTDSKKSSGTGSGSGSGSSTTRGITQPRETRLVDFPIFKGEGQDPVDWIENFKNACTANNVSSEKAITFILAFLRGAPLT
jgi:hypothetical protein